MARAISRFVSPCHTKSATWSSFAVSRSRGCMICLLLHKHCGHKLRQLALRDKYPLLLRLQFPNASSERRALPESGTSVLEWNRAPTLVWQRMPRVALPTEMEAGYRFSLSKRNEI